MGTRSLNKIRLPILTQLSKRYLHYDKIGPPDQLSNLRPTRFAVQEKETQTQIQLRQLREETQQWHQDFWVNHNCNFKLSREQFIDQNSKDGQSGLSSTEMGIFYKKFLDENYVLFRDYNKEWYKKNAKILWLTLKASVGR